MPESRRHFLKAALGCAPAILLGASRLAHSQSRARQQPTPASVPDISLLVENHNPGSRAVIIEGKTLMVSLTFGANIDPLQGSLPIEITPESAGGERLTEPQPLFFYPASDGVTYRTILSAPLDAVTDRPANLLLAVEKGELTKHWVVPYTVQRGAYHSSAFSLSKNFSEPSREIVARMRHDFETMVEIYQRRTPRQWRTAFALPVTSATRNNYGDKRVVNGTKRYRHAGLDFLSPIGTPVKAINSGTVALSDEQWTPGQTICIDHGGGVFSKYMHLSARRVRAGETVTRGQLIGLSGQTGGQKPGPHLHLDLVINGTHVDPIDFMRTAERLITLESS
jgi:murein DD-endopeptidase MepM/ murein hydrolase activator NlpD